MFREELKKIFSNKILILTVVAVSIIPILYAATFLKSIWDPYGQMSNLPVAVVNQDKAVEYNGKQLAVGDEVIGKLKKDHSLDWNFVSAKKAKEGLKDQKYYMIVTLPENFSKDAASVTKKDPKKMDIKFETNGSLNYLGQVVSETAVKELKAQIGESVTFAYAQAVIDSIKEVGNGLTTAADGSGQIKEGAGQLQDGLGELNAKVPELANGVNQLADGSSQLTSGLGQYVAGVSQLADGSKTLNQGIVDFTTGVNQLSAALSGKAEIISEKVKSVQQLRDAINKIATGANQLNNELANQKTLSKEDKENLSQLKTYAESVQKYLNTVNNKLGTIDTKKLTGLVDNFAKIQKQMLGIKDNLANVQAELKDANAKDITNTVSSLVKAGIVAPEKANEVSQILIQNSKTSAVNTLVANKFNELGQALMNIQKSVPEISAENIQNSLAGFNELQSATKQLTGVSGKATAGINELVDSTLKLNDTTNEQLKPAVKQISGALGLVDNELQTSLNDKTLNAAKSQLAMMFAGVNELNNNTDKLRDGSKQLTAGAQELNANSPQLLAGSKALGAGLQQLNANIPALASGVVQLFTGSKTLNEALGVLHDALIKGAEKVEKQPLSNKTAHMMSDPVKTSHKNYSYVPNYGHALAPYFMSVSLFVGAMLFNFIYPIRKIAKKEGTWIQWFTSKVLLATGVAIAMALIMGAVMMMIGLHVDHPLQFFSMLTVFSLTNMFLIMFFAMAFDNPGRFIAMLLLVVQLGGSGGTFPMQVTPEFYNLIHPILPMTYSILGMRQAISSGIGLETFFDCLVILIALLIVALVLLAITMKYLHSHNLVGKSRLNDNQELLDDDYDNVKPSDEHYSIW